MPATKEPKKAAKATAEYCAICGGTLKIVRLKKWERPTTPVVTIHDVDCEECTKCGERYLGPEQLKSVDRKTNDALREARQMMSAEEIDRLVKTLAAKTGMSETAIAKQIGVTRQELHRWRTSDRIQSPMADNFLRYIAEEPVRFATFLNGPVDPGRKPTKNGGRITTIGASNTTKKAAGKKSAARKSGRAGVKQA